MAMSTLYPPIIDTYMPAFVISTSSETVNDACRVYFSLSMYNDINDINTNAVQVTVSSQDTNISCLDSIKYPSGVLITSLQIDGNKKTDDKYYITIYTSDMEEGFDINIYYKVQIRFTSSSIAGPTSKPGADGTTTWPISSWMASNLNAFSEWSTVCLIRGISTPSMKINGFKSESESTLWSSTNVDISGRLTFADERENDTLKSYRIKIYDEKEILLTDSGTIYTDPFANPNEINYTMKFNFKDGESYLLEIDWSTRNLYSATNRFPFNILEEGKDKANITVLTKIDEENGRIGVRIIGNNPAEAFAGSMTIRRTSSETNFTIWEDIRTLTLDVSGNLNIVWWDMTVESGVWYKYCVQKRDSLGMRGVAIVTKDPAMVVSEHTYLVAEDRQLKIKLNPTISSFKYNVMESKVDTIGGKYPFIKRNGNTYYRSFPISGLISFFMDKAEYSVLDVPNDSLNKTSLGTLSSIDDTVMGHQNNSGNETLFVLENKDDVFTNKRELFGENLELWEEWDKEHKINPYNNFIYEREFREKVIEFLYKNNVKLFRSTEEGNILVKLMDINLTPVQGLGRYLYSFNAMAYEIDECNIENYFMYNIQTLLGDFETQLVASVTYLGQMYEETIPPNKDIITMLTKVYQKYNTEGFVSTVQSLNHLRLEFESPPYLIKDIGRGPEPVDDINGESEEILKQAILGYIAEINGIKVVINKEGIYELMGENVEITSLSFPVSTKITINYNAELSQKEDLSQLIKSRTYENKIGQIWGGFKYQDSIYKYLWTKYYEMYPDYTQYLVSLNSLTIEADPGTIIYVKETSDAAAEPHLIGDTCLLELNTNESYIDNVYFGGVQLKAATAAELERNILPEYRYAESNVEFESFNKVYELIDKGISTLEKDEDFYTWNGTKFDFEEKKDNYTLSKNYIYTIEGDKFLWNGIYFEPFTEEDGYILLKKPVEAIVNFTGEIVKGEFNV